MSKNQWFDLDIKQDVARKLSKENYYKTRSWLRNVRRMLMKEIKELTTKKGN